MKKFFVIGLLIWVSVLCAAQTRYALLIGIGQYPESSGWARIHGDNDIPLLKEKLLQSGFEDKNIKTLVNSEATYNAIVAELSNLSSKGRTGDIVYIHFSGHGQQVTDLNGDEEDGYDEAWVPYDAGKRYEIGVYEGDKHLIDDYLNNLFAMIRKSIGKSGRLIIVADACHSGSGSRGYEDDNDDIVYYRGTGDKLELPEDAIKNSYSPVPINWLFISACKDYQINFEYKDAAGNYYGALSYVISKDLEDLTASKYEAAIVRWRNSVKQNIKENLKGKIRMPLQELEYEGKPSTINDELF